LHFYIIFGSLGLFGFITFIIGHIIDIYDSKKYNMLLYNLSKPEEEINTTKNILYIIWNRILLQHSQLSAIMKFDPSLPRVFRLLFVFNRLCQSSVERKNSFTLFYSTSYVCLVGSEAINDGLNNFFKKENQFILLRPLLSFLIQKLFPLQ
jgi:hypothetical protein